MSVAGEVICLASALASGSIVGFVTGFTMASHADILRGVRPVTTNRLVLFFARPSSEIRNFEALALLLVVLAWVPVFGLLCAAPAIVATRLALDRLALAAGYGVACAAFWLLRRFGAHVWRAMT